MCPPREGDEYRSFSDAVFDHAPVGERAVRGLRDQVRRHDHQAHRGGRDEP